MKPGYRGRVSVPNQRELAAEEQLLNEPLYRDLRPRVLELVQRSQGASTVEEWVHLHRDLLIEFGARQDAIDETLPAARQQLRAEIRELAQREPKPIDDIRTKQQILERVGRQELVARASQHTLRQVGDGIAWRGLQYDRRAFTILGEGEPVGRLAQGIGREAELAELGRLWEAEAVFAIHNDLTNRLRHGDLTAIRETEGGASDVTLIEVKAGVRADDTPQLRRLARATELLRDGRQLGDGIVVHVTVVPTAYETYLGVLPELIATARDVGYAWARPHECLLVGAVDYRVWGRESSEYNARSDAERPRVGWGGEEPETLDWTASLRRIRDRGWSFSSLAPYTIFPLDVEDVTDVAMGFVDLAYGFHLPLLERALTREGRDSCPPRRRRRGDLPRGCPPRRCVRVPAHLREQMMVELMTPNALFALLDHVLTLNEQRPDEANDRCIVTFADEAAVWDIKRSSQRALD